MNLPFFPQPKPEPRARTTRRQQRAEGQVKKSVRAAVVARDGYCRYALDRMYTPFSGWEAGPCAGESEWAHLKGHRRSQTRNQAPAIRHTTTHSLMLCRRHHQQEEQGVLTVTYRTARGCDGPIRFDVKETR